MVRYGHNIRVMRMPSSHWNLLATGALALISIPAVGLDSGLAFVGTITDRFQKPLPGTVVTLSSNERVLQTRASSQGQFRFEHVPRGVYQLELKAHGFVRQTLSVDLSAAEAPPLAIVLQGPTEPDVEECGPPHSIVYSSFDSTRPQLAGIVRSYDQRKTLRRADVALMRVDDPRLTSHTVSDDDGRFQFENLTAGRYNLRISLHGYVLAEMKQLLVPHENNVTLDVSVRRDDGKLIVCQ
jgi:hypothetical protein